ncbi:hypothetical protein FOXB_00814 [Fusarium oxysporum f. sp. conglutinans Fo5176]|nr:hypothetical protein FOXB_00814 [Fusarium oxysporum f. sp. conglutinans Fo5176]
MQEKNRI